MIILSKNIWSCKKSAADKLKASSKGVIQKATDATGGLIGNKTADRITKNFKNS